MKPMKGSMMTTTSQLKALRFAESFPEINWMDSAFFSLWWFKFAHTCIQVTTLHKGDTTDFIKQIFDRKSISRNLIQIEFWYLTQIFYLNKIQGLMMFSVAW